MTVVFVDTETTGLDPAVHEVWEIALIAEDGTEYEWRMNPQRLGAADSGALRINRMYERANLAAVNGMRFWTPDMPPDAVAEAVCAITAGCHLVGVVPDFDARFLERFVRAHGFAPAWHYQTIDAEVYAAGRLQLMPPFDGAKIDRMLGLDPAPEEDKHTAIGDARWARRMYTIALMAPP